MPAEHSPEYPLELFDLDNTTASLYKHDTQRTRSLSMAKSLTKSQIADHLAQKSGLTKKAVIQFLADYAGLAYREAKNGFPINGLGKLVLRNRKARIGRNPQTGEEIKIPAKRVVKFRIAKAAKDAILGSK